MIGTKLAHYEITSHLGSGGMGEVYQATDSKLGRSVAIKLLPEAFSRDADRLARFEREARVLASLNHPNIAAIYGVEESGSRKFLVMELVPGETLAERIKRAPVPIDQALPIAQQIAEALEAAHEKGVIHRDLKPANVKITPDGKVKVLDFGLAKAMDIGPASATQSNSPTIISGSISGAILGTAAYMSPEQAHGQAVDKRTDIWSFGVVLYEMLTGRRLFEGQSLSDTLAAVLRTEPQWDQVPGKALRLLQQCLEKDPRKRLRDIGDARLLLEQLPKDSIVLPTGTLWWKVAAVTLALIAAVALWAPWRAQPAPGLPALRLDFDLGLDLSLLSATGPFAILSPDGTRLVFVAMHTGAKSSLFTRRLDQPKATEMAGTAGGYGPFFSPNGQWVGFFADGKMKKVRLDGGDPIILCEAPAGRGASWSDDDRIIVALDTNQGLSSVPSEGGTPVLVTHLDPSTPNSGHRWPQVLPGSKAVLFTTSANGDYREGSIKTASLVDGQIKPLIEGKGMYGRYVAGGYLVYMHNGTLVGVRFDADRLEVHGDPVTLLEQVSSRATGGSAALDFSQNGAVVYRSGRETGVLTVQWLDAAGKTAPLLVESANYLFPRLSPGGQERLSVALVGGSSPDAWVYDLQLDRQWRLLTGVGTTTLNLTWSNPDGRYLVFHSAGGMSWTRADGNGKPQPLTKSTLLQYPWSFTPDGSRLAFYQQAESGYEIWTVAVESDAGQLRAGKAEMFLKLPSGNSNPAFSPDGHWIAYASTESGDYEVYVRAFPDNGDRVSISNSGGVQPVWSQKTNELFYRSDDRHIMVANYTVKENNFRLVGKPRVWSERQLADTGLNPSFDLAPDGKRFAVLLPAENPEPLETKGHVTMILNFFDELRRRIPDGK